MKTKLTISMLALAAVACGVLLAAVNLDDIAKTHLKAMRDDGSITNVVNMLVTDGTVCQLRGHKWEFGCGVIGCLVNHTGPMRNCVVCGTTQTQEIGPWR